MPPKLSEIEARVVGCLLEKSVLTPDQYPLTLNALTGACNQKSGREPVMSLEPGAVQRTARGLAERGLVRVDENPRTGVEKYSQRICNTPYSHYQLDSAAFAVVCLLLLRGPQTPGELRTRAGRLHGFADNSEVVRTLAALMEHEEGALVVQLPRTAGRKDSEYMHLFFGPVDLEAYARSAGSTAAADAAVPRVTTADLARRVEALESEVADLRERLSRLAGDRKHEGEA